MLSTTSVVNTYGGSRRLAQLERCSSGWGCVRLGLFCRQRCPPEGIVGATRQRREARAVDSCGRFPAAADGFPGQRAPPAESVDAFPVAVLPRPTVTDRQSQGRAGCCGTPGRLRNPPPCPRPSGTRHQGLRSPHDAPIRAMSGFSRTKAVDNPRVGPTRSYPVRLRSIAPPVRRPSVAHGQLLAGGRRRPANGERRTAASAVRLTPAGGAHDSPPGRASGAVPPGLEPSSPLECDSF